MILPITVRITRLKKMKVMIYKAYVLVFGENYARVCTDLKPEFNSSIQISW